MPSYVVNNPFRFASSPVGKVVVLLAVVELLASMASAHPSPSESKSREFVLPSLSVSIVVHTL